MTKADIVNEIAKSTGINAKDVSTVIEEFMGTVKDSVANKENVYLRGFGTFGHRVARERKARNISAGTVVTIPAHGEVKFKPANDFKEAVR